MSNHHHHVESSIHHTHEGHEHLITSHSGHNHNGMIADFRKRFYLVTGDEEMPDRVLVENKQTPPQGATSENDATNLE